MLQPTSTPKPTAPKPTPAPQPPAACPTSASPAPWVYSDLVKDHFLSPRNFLMGDESAYSCDAVGTVGNPVCGDQMRMFLRIRDGRITDLKWKTYGCASAIASTSALSELAKGQTLDEALKIGPAQIAAYLGGLPQHKFHCSVLGHEALAAAIADYRSRTDAERSRTDTNRSRTDIPSSSDSPRALANSPDPS